MTGSKGRSPFRDAALIAAVGVHGPQIEVAEFSRRIDDPLAIVAPARLAFPSSSGLVSATLLVPSPSMTQICGLTPLPTEKYEILEPSGLWRGWRNAMSVAASKLRLFSPVRAHDPYPKDALDIVDGHEVMFFPSGVIEIANSNRSGSLAIGVTSLPSRFATEISKSSSKTTV